MQMGRIINILDERVKMLIELDRLKEWVEMNRIKLSREKYQVLYLGKKIAKLYRMEENLIGSSTNGNELGVPVEHILNMNL